MRYNRSTRSITIFASHSGRDFGYSANEASIFLAKVQTSSFLSRVATRKSGFLNIRPTKMGV